MTVADRIEDFKAGVLGRIAEQKLAAAERATAAVRAGAAPGRVELGPCSISYFDADGALLSHVAWDITSEPDRIGITFTTDVANP